MRTKSPGIGLTIAAVGVGSAFAALQLGGVTVPVWAMLTVFILSVLMIVVGVVLTVVGRPSGRDEPKLRQRTAALSGELLDFLADRRRDDPSCGVPRWFGLPPNASEARKQRAFDQETQEITSYLTETMSRYALRYKVRALKLFDDLRDANLINASQGHQFEHPTNPIGIEKIAMVLGVIGEGGGATPTRSIWHRLASHFPRGQQ